MDLVGIEGVIGELARRQHGVVARRQLVAAGLSGDVVDRRVKAGRLRPIHRGVYLTTPLPTPHAREIAACLACGPAAVVSHRSAATLWQLIAPPTTPGEVDILLPRGNRRRPGIRIRRLRSSRRDEITELKGMRVTTVERTLLDLAASAPARDLEQALARALARGLTRPAALRRLLTRQAGAPGSPGLRALLEARDRSGGGSSGGGPALTRSEAEERFLALVRAAGLDEPEVNAGVAGYEVDFLWRRQRVVVEVDGYAYHSSRGAFEADRRRDATLAAAGLRVVRVTWRQIEREREAVLVRLARTLG